MSIFAANAAWWNSGRGAAGECPYRTGYSRGEVLKGNPAFARLLPRLNHHVLTFDGQEACAEVFRWETGDPPHELIGSLLAQEMDRGFSAKDLGRYACALAAGGTHRTFQRFYLSMVCRDVAQARAIADAVEDLCVCEIATGPGEFEWEAPRHPVTIEETDGFRLVHTRVFAISAHRDKWYAVVKPDGVPDGLPVLTVAAREFVGAAGPGEFVDPATQAVVETPTRVESPIGFSELILGRILAAAEKGAC